MKTPRYNFENVPICQVGMGVEAARLNGYKHGFQNVVTRGVCSLVKDSDEYKVWQEGYTEGEADAGLVYRVFIHLGEKEYGNERMRQLADEYAWQHPDHRPLIVEVHEHAGWHLSYLYGAPHIDDGTICGTANDAASLAPAVVEFGKSIGTERNLGDIRR